MASDIHNILVAPNALKSIHTDVRELLELGLLDKDSRGHLWAPRL